MQVDPPTGFLDGYIAWHDDDDDDDVITSLGGEATLLRAAAAAFSHFTLKRVGAIKLSPFYAPGKKYHPPSFLVTKNNVLFSSNLRSFILCFFFFSGLLSRV